MENSFELDTTGLSDGTLIQKVYKTSSGDKLIPNGELSVRPKKGVSIESVISASGAKLKVKRKSRRGTYYLELNNRESILDVANRIYEGGKVVFSIPNFIASVKANSNDPYFQYQYYLQNTGQSGATPGIDINLGTTLGTNNDIKVAVIDYGVEAHEDLTGRVLPGYTPSYPTEYGAPGTSSGPNSVHGQAVAGIIAATRDNNLGIAGIAPNAKIIPVNIFRSVDITISEIAEAIDWSWEVGGADVLNNSWTFKNTVYNDPVINAAISDAITYGRGGKGCVVVFASGNRWMNTPEYPSNLPGVLTVGAINKNGGLTDYSSFGSELDLVAPSGGLAVYGADSEIYLHGDVYSLDRMGSAGLNAHNYMTVFGGTSAAAPQVSGAAALLLSLKPDLTSSQISSYLTSTATDMGATGFDISYGYGRLNVAAAYNRVLVDYFNLSGNNVPVTGSVPLYDLISSSGYHYFTTNSTVSVSPSQIFGYVFVWPVSGTVPLLEFIDVLTGKRYYSLTNSAYPGYAYEKIAGYVYASHVSRTLPVYEHYTTAGSGSYLFDNKPGTYPNYTFNDVKFYVLQQQQNSIHTLPGEDWAEFYVYYNWTNYDHYYTTETQNPPGWSYENVLSYISRIPRSGMIPLYRYFHRTKVDHYYTVVKQDYGDWKYEGIAGYVYSSTTTGAVAIHQYMNFKWDHVYTNQYLNLGPDNTYEGIKFYMKQYPY